MDLTPPAYLVDLAAYLRQREPALWGWFSSHGYEQEHANAVRLELLKSTVRLDRETHAGLYEAADHAARALGIELPITLYQAAGADSANAALWYVPEEVHIVLCGPISAALSPDELRALMGHELGHHRLLREENGAFHVAEQLLRSMAQDPRAEPSHHRTAHLSRLYTESYADRASLTATGSLDPVVTCLVKVETGLPQASASAYLAQADEIFARAEPTTEGVTHPETFIRARALSLFARGDPASDAELRRMLEGPLALDRLDLLGQVRLTELTRRLLGAILSEPWMRSEAALAHARLYFPDFAPPQERDTVLPQEISEAHPTLRDYCCFLMLDFASVDPSLEDLPLAHALCLSDAMKLRDRLEELAHRELRVTKKALLALRETAPALLARAAGRS